MVMVLVVTIGSIITGMVLLTLKAQSKIKHYSTVHCSSKINSPHTYTVEVLRSCQIWEYFGDFLNKVQPIF